MIKDFLENLQKQPEPVKKSVMWISIFFIMLIIFFFWVMTFSWNAPESHESEDAAALKKELPSAWSSLKDQASAMFQLLENNKEQMAE